MIVIAGRTHVFCHAAIATVQKVNNIGRKAVHAHTRTALFYFFIQLYQKAFKLFFGKQTVDRGDHRVGRQISRHA